MSRAETKALANGRFLIIVDMALNMIRLSFVRKPNDPKALSCESQSQSSNELQG
jgi:hypothetical protein